MFKVNHNRNQNMQADKDYSLDHAPRIYYSKHFISK